MAWFKNTENKEHTYVAERLCAYLDGELSAQEQAIVERHLPECPHCQWDLQTLRQTAQWAREMPTVAVPCSFAIPVPARQRARPWWSWSVPVMQGATALVAAMLLLVVAGDFLLTGGLWQASSPAALPAASTSDVAMQEAALEEQPTEEAMALMAAPTEEAAAQEAGAEPEATVEVESLMAADTAVVEEQEVEAPNAKVGGEPPPRSAFEEGARTPPPEFGTMSAAEIVTPTEGLGGGLEPGDAEAPMAEAEVASDAVTAPVPPAEETAPEPLPTSPVTTLDAPPAEPTSPALVAAPEKEEAAPAEGEAEPVERGALEQRPPGFWLDAAKVGLSILLVLLLASTLILTSLRGRAE